MHWRGAVPPDIWTPKFQAGGWIRDWNHLDIGSSGASVWRWSAMVAFLTRVLAFGEETSETILQTPLYANEDAEAERR